MAPTVLQLSGQLRQIIYYHLDNDLLPNALFFAERLHGLEPRSADALHLLALCHHRLGEHKTAYDYIRPFALRASHLACSYVFAQVCLLLKKNGEGIHALERVRPLWDGRNTLYKHSDTIRRPLPDAAAVFCLLGKLHQADREIKRAVDCHVEALKLNPFMWDAFERLCDTGAIIRPSNIFKPTPDLLSMMSSSNIMNTRMHTHEQGNATGPSSFQTADNQAQAFTPNPDPFTNMRNNGAIVTDSSLGGETPPAENAPRLPRAQRDQVASTTIGLDLEPPNAPPRKSRSAQIMQRHVNSDNVKSRIFSSREPARPISEDSGVPEATMPTIASQHKRTISGSLSHNNGIATNLTTVAAPQRRSRRLFGKPPSIGTGTGSRDSSEQRKVKAIGTKGRIAAPSTVGRVVSGNRKPVDAADLSFKEARPQTVTAELSHSIQRSAVISSASDVEALQWLLDLLDRLGNGYCASSRFQCQAALSHYQSIPQQQRETPWVLAQVGKALHEQSKYSEAERVFSRLRKRVPSRMCDMEIYSTVLWHLKSDTELAFLSHELVDADRFAPQAWCTIGNSFSLQRDHDQALKCFRRATQLDPAFAYAFTLQGHEYSANEEYEKAQQAYRRAVSADHRHYNGWYGLAKVYEKLGKYDLADEHYRAAASINPTNPVLIWSIGVILEKQKNPQAALLLYKRACELNPSSAMPRFKKARILLNLQRFEEALEEFNVLKDMAPDESNVHFMLGKVHKQLGHKAEAVKHFTIALNLDPKAAPHIKETMESIDQEDEEISDEDEEMS